MRLREQTTNRDGDGDLETGDCDDDIFTLFQRILFKAVIHAHSTYKASDYSGEFYFVCVLINQEIISSKARPSRGRSC